MFFDIMIVTIVSGDELNNTEIIPIELQSKLNWLK